MQVFTREFVETGPGAANGCRKCRFIARLTPECSKSMHQLQLWMAHMAQMAKLAQGTFISNVAGSLNTQ